MKFASEVLANVDGIQHFYITGIFIFLALFVIILYRTFKIPKRDLHEYKTSILDYYDENNKTTIN